MLRHAKDYAIYQSIQDSEYFVNLLGAKLHFRLSGWYTYPTPLKNNGLRQLGLFFRIGKIIIHSMVPVTTNQWLLTIINQIYGKQYGKIMVPKHQPALSGQQLDVSEGHWPSWSLTNDPNHHLTGALYVGNFREWSIIHHYSFIIIPATPSNPQQPPATHPATLRKTHQ